MSARTLDILSLYERNQEATLYVGNVDPQVDEELLWEFFIQVGLVKSIHIPRDKVTGQHQGYGFVEFETEDDADYAVRVLNFIKLYNKPLRCNKASRDKQNVEVGANLFVGNIDDEVDEKLLHDTFSTFGNVILTKIVREGDGVNEGRSYAFISYDNFESSDAALAAMNGQFICNKPIHVSYAYKKDTKGERHGSAAERLIAANRPTEFLNQMGVAPYGSSQMSIPTYSQGSVMSPPMTNVYQTNIHPSMLPQANLVTMPPLPMQTYNR